MKQLLAVDWKPADPEPYMSINSVPDELVDTIVNSHGYELCGEITSSDVVRQSDLDEPAYTQRVTKAQNEQLWLD